MNNLAQYTGIFHLVLSILGVLGYFLYMLREEKALIRSVFLCIDNGKLEMLGSYFGINEYLVKKGKFEFVIEEHASILSGEMKIRIFHQKELVYEKCSWEIWGYSCKSISNKINNKLKAA